MFHDLNQPELFQCPTAWILIECDKKEEFCIATLNVVGEVPTVEKCIKVNKDCQVSFWINGQQFGSDELGIIPGKSVTQFNDNIKTFELILVCQGGPSAKQFPIFSEALCTTSPVGLLRHNECEAIIKTKSNCCPKCKCLKNILRLRNKRKASGCEQKLEVTPTKKKKIDIVRKRANNNRRTVVRKNKKIISQKKKLDLVQNEMSDYSGSIEDKLKKLTINESQKSLIMECFAAAKVKNSRNRRYSENWLMLCLLFNIRSPTAYKYLRTTELLPLPHPKTVRKYLSSIKTTCGFDQDFLSLLEKKINQMTEMAKHGVLLFDSISLRKSLAVNSSNLTYRGLEDFGDEDNSDHHKEYVDHALVFMWQSLSSNFYQTIGCFASKGEVKGN